MRHHFNQISLINATISSTVVYSVSVMLRALSHPLSVMLFLESASVKQMLKV